MKLCRVKFLLQTLLSCLFLLHLRPRIISFCFNHVPLQLTMNGLAKSINSEVLIPSFKSISPPPNQKKSGLSLRIASSKITCDQNIDPQIQLLIIQDNHNPLSKYIYISTCLSVSSFQNLLSANFKQFW